QRLGIERTGPGGRLPSSLTQRIDREDVEDAVASGGEVDPLVVVPHRSLVGPAAARDLAQVAGRDVEHEEIAGSVNASVGAVGGEHEPAPIGAGAGVQVLVDVAGERL